MKNFVKSDIADLDLADLYADANPNVIWDK